MTQTDTLTLFTQWQILEQSIINLIKWIGLMLKLRLEELYRPLPRQLLAFQDYKH